MFNREGKTLYRDPDHGKIAGVCAGLGAYLGIEVWLLRVIMASAIILTGFFGLPLLIYIISWFVLDKKPVGPLYKGSEQDAGYVKVKSHIWQQGKAPAAALDDISLRYEHIETRLRQLEACVTSREFALKREIDRL